MRKLVVIAHNLRSAHNVGSLLRTAEGLGVEEVLFSGYTPYPVSPNDERLPHEAQKITKLIAKTALGTEKQQQWRHLPETISTTILSLKEAGYSVVALEQAPGSISLPDYQAPERLAIIIGREVEGIEPEVLALSDEILEIPMLGQKESYNVVQAAAMALYQCRFIST